MKNRIGVEMTMLKLKLISALILAILSIIWVLQNTESVQTKFLFVTVTMPQAVLLGITILVGVAVGILLALGLSGKWFKNDK